MKMRIRLSAAILVRVGSVTVAACLSPSAGAHSQSNDPCSGVAAANERQRALEQQIAKEANPLRREDLKARLNQARSSATDAFNRVKNANQGRFAGLTGRVTAFDKVSYNGSYGFVLVIALPCGAKLSFRFREITNPAWGGMDPNHDTPLAPWRRALETIVIGDTVTVSGKFEDKFFFDSLAAVMTRLQKRGGPVYEVPGLQQNSAPQVNTAPPPLQRNASVQTDSGIFKLECIRADNASATATLVVDFQNGTVMSPNGFGGLRVPASAQINDTTVSWRNQVVRNYGEGGIMNFAGSIDRVTHDFTFTTADNNILIFKCRQRAT